MECLLVLFHHWTVDVLVLAWILLAISSFACLFTIGIKYGDWYRILRFLLSGPRLIEEEYAKSEGKPFVVDTPKNRNILISSSEHIRELSNVNGAHLSLHAVVKEIFQPQWTMQGFDWPDARGKDGIEMVRTLRNFLNTNLEKLSPAMRSSIGASLERQVSEAHKQGYRSLSLLPLVMDVVISLNGLVFFGPQLAEDRVFIQKVVSYLHKSYFMAEIIRLLPEFLAPVLGVFFPGRVSSWRYVFDTLAPIADERLQNMTFGTATADQKPLDGLQWILEHSERESWTVVRVVHEILALWYGAVQPVSIAAAQAVQDLCVHRTWIDRIRDELRTLPEEYSVKDLESLPLLDAFVRESARWNGFEAISGRRKALFSFRFSDGLQVGKGDWVGIPQRAMLRDPRRWADPDRFDPFRMLAGENANWKYADSSKEWPIWGSGRLLCPGRFYSSLAIKLIVAELTMNWDLGFEAGASKAPAQLTWRTATVPALSTRLMIRPREA